MQGWEWIIIGAVAIVLILWGPRLPEFAKTLTKRKNEPKEYKMEAKTGTPLQVGANVIPVCATPEKDN